MFTDYFFNFRTNNQLIIVYIIFTGIDAITKTIYLKHLLSINKNIIFTQVLKKYPDSMGQTLHSPT